ncbi:PhzF family phenazine biosynthesis protein [Chromobacterium haemolyticum]|uniref:PhzF family phenazine biosynthesis protein n=1 Tax=Chromobacterium haemolyticum TaxID=394935 RepID=UPI0009DAB5F7|nr:PhzF family phenazine biosynthesis protein [Chromobacterium haemolyticum]OQS39668.1 phenazine biosynthesis protein [Chromobacterium haemolyticum]PTU68403.1 PhzF family phenazine biosynthesis protein [Chromobacterium haemolyticum]
MSGYSFELVNVFAEERFGGNPLAVFSDASGLDEREMQLLARQMNLSETVFLFPDEEAAARLRIFTPSQELPFAGHPTLGAAAVLHWRGELDSRFQLRTNAGLIPILHSDGVYTLRANPPSARAAGLSRAQAAAMLGLDEEDVALEPVWVDTGSEQLLIRAASAGAVLRARPVHALLLRDATLRPGRSVAYLWHEDGGVATVRLFFEQQGAVLEDPGTGSACANLGGWCALNGLGPLQWRVEQGAALARPNVLHLQVGAEGEVLVGGRVQRVGRGEIFL